MKNSLSIIQTIPELSYDQENLEQICSELEIRLLIFFGSRATGRPQPSAESDLDLAVLFQPGRDLKQIGKCWSKLSDIFEGQVLDLTVLNLADPLFRYEVLRDGILLYGDEDNFLEYKAFAFRDFVDSQDLRNLEEKLFQKKMQYIRNQLQKIDKTADDTP